MPFYWWNDRNYIQNSLVSYIRIFKSNTYFLNNSIHTVHTFFSELHSTGIYFCIAISIHRQRWVYVFVDTHTYRDMINSSTSFPFTDKNLYYYSSFWIIIYSSKSFINLLCKLHIDLVLSMKSEHFKIFMCQAPKIQIYNESYTNLRIL